MQFLYTHISREYWFFLQSIAHIQAMSRPSVLIISAETPIGAARNSKHVLSNVLSIVCISSFMNDKKCFSVTGEGKHQIYLGVLLQLLVRASNFRDVNGEILEMRAVGDLMEC